MSPRRSRKRRISRRKPSRSRKLPIAIGLVAVIAVVIAAFYVFTMNGNPTGNRVLLKTNKGDITIQLRDDRPITTSNFKSLVQQGVYDGTIFHRVEYDFVIQGGDPTGTGYGDPSIPNIQDELDGDNRNNRGTVAMANTGQPNTGSSQFFINLVDNNYLDEKHSVFGTVISGMNIVDEIANVATDADYRPVIDVTLIDAEIIS